MVCPAPRFTYRLFSLRSLLMAAAIALCQPSSAQTPSDAQETIGEWRGTLTMVVADDLVHQLSSTRWIFSTPDRIYDIASPGNPSWHSGRSVKISGIARGGSIVVREIEDAATSNASSQGCTTLGPQNIAVLMLTTPSNTAFPSAFSKATLQETFFGSSTDTSSTQSLNGFWTEMSYGLASATGQVFGPFALSKDYTFDTQGQMATEAVNVADATVDFSQFTRIALVFPLQSNNDWGGAAADSTIGCGIIASPRKGSLPASISWLPAFPLSSPPSGLYAHELGHGLGLGHSSSDDYGSIPLGPLNTPGKLVEYGDPFSLMGYPYPFGITSGQYTAEHKSLLLQWLLPGDYLEVSTPGTYTLAPYETSGLRALRILRNAATKAWLWIEYRQPIGDIDSNLQATPSTNVFGGALIHYEDPNLDTPHHTYLLDFNPTATPNNFASAALTPGQTWSDPYSPLSLTVKSATPEGLSITVGYSSTPGQPPPPPKPGCTLALSSASQGFSAMGGSGQLTVTAPSGCSWSALSTASWLTFSPATPAGTGAGSVQFSVAANSTASPRSGFVMAGGEAFPVSQTGAALITAGGVVAVDSTVATIQPGEWVSIYGTNLANTTTAWSGNFPTSLGGASVTINGKAAYLSYVSPTQINLQAPYDTATGSVPVIVTTVNGTAASSVTLAQFAPSFLLLGGQYVAGIILRQDGSGAYGGGTYDIIGPAGNAFGYPTVNVKAGDSIELFAIGLGPTTPSVPVGQAYSGAARTTNPVRVFINNVGLTPSFAGLSGAGLYQINVTVPSGLGTGDASLVATVGTAQTQPGVVISLPGSTFSAPYVQSLTLSPNPVASGGTVTGTIALSGPAPPGGAVVQLSENGISVPPTVTVPAGATLTTFTLTAGTVSCRVAALVVALYGGRSAASPVTILPPPSAPPPLTLTPGDVLQATFTSVANASDMLLFFNQDSLTLTGSPVVTTQLLNGTTLLGSIASPPFLFLGTAQYQATFLSPSSTYIGPAGLTARADLTSMQNGTIQGVLKVTVSGGSVSGFCQSDFSLYDAQSVNNGYRPENDLQNIKITLQKQ
jgi:uncharacterized protein (TIGR03437 family)